MGTFQLDLNKKCKRDLCCHAVSVRLSARPSVTFMDSVETNRHISLIFLYQTSIFRRIGRKHHNGASNAGEVSRNRDSEPTSGSIACCQRCDRLCVINTSPPGRGKLWHLSLVAVTGGGCWWRRRQRNVYDKNYQRYAIDNRTSFIVHSDKYLAYVTSNKRLCNPRRFCRAMLASSAAVAVMRCPCVCLCVCVCHVRRFCQNE